MPYSDVRSMCLARNAEYFRRHDPYGWQRFTHAATITEQVRFGTLAPHELLFSSRKTAGLSDDLVQAQCQSFVAMLRKKSGLVDAIVLCDVSGSVEGQPMKIAISLGMLIAAVTSPPWRNHVIAFSEQQRFHFIESATLVEQVQSISKMGRDSSTDDDHVFDHVLRRAQDHNVHAHGMPRTLFVLTDTDLDKAVPTMTSMTLARIDVKYAAAGHARPSIVFWDLRASSGVSVSVTSQGTILVSGYNDSLLKLFLKGQDFREWTSLERFPDEAVASLQPTRMDIPRTVIDDERLGGLKVVDSTVGRAHQARVLLLGYLSRSTMRTPPRSHGTHIAEDSLLG